jgi:hypothetical protein
MLECALNITKTKDRTSLNIYITHGQLQAEKLQGLAAVTEQSIFHLEILRSPFYSHTVPLPTILLRALCRLNIAIT